MHLSVALSKIRMKDNEVSANKNLLSPSYDNIYAELFMKNKVKTKRKQEI